ncbi:uncharacterized protein [Ptychodera flava]|uniref:uncharacterized protein n=1 Tax=Ptychodera flava TaxID=63121 RepID=UPI00396AACCB
MLTFILNRNYFEFNGKFFLQTMGTAMGTMTAPSYANIPMGQIEDTTLKQAEHKPEKWKRFIDDVRFLWNHGLDKLLLIQEYSNIIHPTVKFTINYSTEKLPFLDTTMINENGKIATTIYTKPTDKHSYLWSTSCHPKHIFKSIPWSQSLRYRRICSDTNKYDTASEALHNHLTHRGYNHDVIKNAIEGARLKSRSQLLQPRRDACKPTTEDRIPLVITFNPKLPNIPAIINKYWDILQATPDTRDIFCKPPIVSYRQPSNLSKILVRARVLTTT